MSDPCASTIESMMAAGWRQCAKGQRTTQFCGQMNQAQATINELAGALQSMFNEHGEFEYNIETLGKARAALAKLNTTKE